MTRQYDACDCVAIGRQALSEFHNRFEISVALFELLERGGGPASTGVLGGVFIQYRMIAARDGALSLYHFGCSLSTLVNQSDRCKTFKGKYNKVALNEAMNLFDRTFPNIDNIRNGIAHRGEFFTIPLRLQSHRLKSDYVGAGATFAAGALAPEALNEKTYAIGNKGAVFELMINSESCGKLGQIAMMAQGAFA